MCVSMYSIISIYQEWLFLIECCKYKKHPKL